MKYLRATLLLLLAATPAFAQSDRGTITGQVLDPSAAVVPGARIVVRNMDTGTLSETVATSTGNYAVTSLPAGAYEVTAEAPGFKKTVRKGIQVQVAAVVRVDFALEVGAQSESVTVTAEAPLLRTENAEQSMNISGERVNALPLNFGGGGGSTGAIRNWMSFIILAPGVSGSSTANPGSNAINGATGGAFKIYLEGQDVTSSNDTVWTSTVASAGVESIGEFSMQTSNFSAEFGQVNGGVFNFTTKSGTNKLHGSGFEYFSNEALDAARPLTVPGTPHTRPLDRKHDFGFSVGGPVWIPKLYDGRNKTFFFFSLEVFRVKTSFLGTGTMPTTAYRNGDFSAALTGRQLGTDPLGRPIIENAVYNPVTERTVGGQVVRDAFQGNIVPKSLLDQVALKIQDLLPNPTTSNLVNNFQVDVGNHKYQSIPSIKIDHSFSNTTKLSGYWSVQHTDQITGPNGLPAPITSQREQLIYGHTTRLNLDKTVTPTLLIHMGAGYLRFHNPDSSPPSVLNYDAVGKLGLSGSATNPAGFPYISAANSNAGGLSYQLGPNTAGLYFNDKLTAVASAAYVRNNHSFKLGGEFKQEVWTDNNYYQSQGFYNFNAAQTALPYLQTTSLGGGTLGFPYASFLMGLVQNATVAAPRTLQWRKKSWAAYLQDDWRFTRKLTIGLGLRWDLSGQGHELHYRTSQIGVNTPNPSAGGLPGGIMYEGYGPGRCNCSFTQTYPYAVAPRLSAAYQINDKTVIRAAWGLTYASAPNWWYVTGGSSSLGVGFNAISFSNPAFGAAALPLQGGLKYNTADLYVASYDPGIVPQKGQLNVPAAWGGQINDHNGGRPARINQWNIAIQREVLPGLSVEAAYVGNRGVWLEANNLVNVNAINPATLAARGLDLNNAADRTLLTSQIGSALAASRGFKAPYAGYPTTATVAQTLRPFPEYNNSLAVRWAPLGNSWYDAMQVKVTKRYSHGLDMTGSFSWQKEQALGAGGNPGPSGPTVNNVFNRQNQKSITSYSTPLVLVIGFNYKTQRWGSNRFLQRIVADWTFGGVLRYASGYPIPVPSAQNNLSSLLYQNTLANRVPGVPLFLKDPNCKCFDVNKEFILNPKAWSDPAPGQWGTASGYYSDYRWQRQAAESLSIGRTFPIREKMSFQIRAEFFNVFNRLQLGGFPSTGNALATQTFNSQGIPTSGFGYFNANGSGVSAPRNGQIVARFQF